MDLYDLKPEAPAEYRGIWRPIRTNVPGIEISELFPRQAKVADKSNEIVAIPNLLDLLAIKGVVAVQSDSLRQLLTDKLAEAQRDARRLDAPSPDVEGLLADASTAAPAMANVISPPLLPATTWSICSGDGFEAV